MTTAESQGKSWPLFLAVAGYLVLRCLWRLFVPGGGWPVPPWHYLSMASDILLLVVLIVLRSRLAPVLADDPSRRRLADIAAWGGSIAGFLLLAIRFTSEAAWWTGHFRHGGF
jgi:hypothetical protein